MLSVLYFLAIIGAPEVKCIPHVRSIKFLIHSPYTPLRGEDGHQLNIEDIYSKFSTVDYHLTIFNQRTHQKVTDNLRAWSTFVDHILHQVEKGIETDTRWMWFLTYRNPTGDFSTGGTLSLWHSADKRNFKHFSDNLEKKTEFNSISSPKWTWQRLEKQGM